MALCVWSARRSKAPRLARAAAGVRRSGTLAMKQLTLHCKAGPDGTSYGACPFAHAIRLCLESKSLSYKLEPHGPDNKPVWLLDNPNVPTTNDIDKTNDALRATIMAKYEQKADLVNAIFDSIQYFVKTKIYHHMS